MRSLYGTRSIIPNNYYFTFDRIYKEHPTKYNNDNVLIGRAVLYEPDSSVFLKTSEGYIKVAQLDNTGRLIRNEGYVLDALKGDVNINELSGDSYTYNGDGVYIVNFNDLYNDNTYMQLKNLDDYSFSQVYYYYDETEKKYKEGICEANYMKKTNLFYLTTLKDETVLAPLYTINSFSSWNLGTTDDKFDNQLFEIQENASPKGYFLQFERSLLTDNILPNYYYIEHNSSNEYYKKISKEEVKKYLELKTEVFYLKENSEISQLNNDNDYYVEDNSGKHILEKIIRTTDGIDVPSFREKTDKDIGIRQSYSKIDNKEQYCYVSRTAISPFTSTSKIEENIEDYYIKINIFLENTEGVLLTSAENLNNQQKNEKDLYYKFYADSENLQTSIKIMNQARFKLDIHIGYYFNSINDKNPSENWPSIRGIPKEEYLKDSVFLLEQRSNSPKQDAKKTMYQIDQNSVTSSMSNLYAYQTKTESNGTTQITNNVIREPFINDPVNWSLATSANVSVGQKAIIEMEVYQILTDISYLKDYNSSEEILKKDPDKDRINLNHLNKTFIRKGKRTFYLSEYYNSLPPSENKPNITSTVRYIFDEDSGNGFMSVSSETEESSEVNLYRCKTDWGKWEDVTEQYTGYIGDLDPYTVGFMSPLKVEESGAQSEYVFAQLPYNKHTQYYTDDQGENIADIDQVAFDNSCDSNGVSSTYYVKANANRGNLNNSNTLVEATNILDEIIGSKTRLKGTQVNQITQGSLSEALAKDFRPYNIPEDDIMDTLVHHDADIGAIEGLKAGQDKDNNTNNLNFTTVKEPIDENELQVNDIQSIKDALIILDNLIGARRRLDDGTLATNDITLIDSKADYDDERPVYIPENNIIDSIIHHDADIGKIETLSNENDTYNLTFTKQNEQPDNINSSNNATVQVRSLTDAITKLDNMIGYISRLGSKDRALVNSTGHANKKITGTGETDDGRIYDIPETNIIDTIVHHDADIGFIEDFNAISMQDGSIMANNNNITFTNSGNFNNIARDEKGNLTTAQVNSLTEAIYTLDKIIGPVTGFNYTAVNTQHNNNGYDFSNDQEDNRAINIPEDNIVYAIGHHDADIGAIEDLKAGQEENNNTHNLNFVKTGKSSNLDNENNKISDINSLTEAIIKLDNMIGYLGRLNANNENGDYVNTNNGSQGITGTGNNGDARPYSIPETTVIDTLVHHDADIGAIEELNGKNIEFTQKEKDEDNKHEIHSLTDAITILDNIIGNYDGIENEKLEEEELEPNLKNYNADLVTAINHLSKSVVGYKSGLNNDKNLNTEEKRDTLVTAINTLDNILGKFDKAGTNNLNLENITTFISAIKKLDSILGVFDVTQTNNLNLENIKTFISAIKKLDTLLGTINAETIGSESVSKQIQSINSSISKINTVLEKYQVTDLMSYIKNLAENVDVLDVTIHNMMNEQSLMEWGTF